ncbi:MAG TPA: hypothetical protein VFE46_07535 [Pirellulales bacterium]|jgi:hypothetical protein|nr:hypothetical protein [Pirellulales bacterium]
MKVRSQFSLRTLLVITGLIAVASGWICYQLDWIRQRKNFLAQDDVYWLRGWMYKWEPIEPSWPLRIFGPDGVAYLQVSDLCIDKARKLFPELDSAHRIAIEHEGKIIVPVVPDTLPDSES